MNFKSLVASTQTKVSQEKGLSVLLSHLHTQYTEVKKTMNYRPQIVLFLIRPKERHNPTRIDIVDKCSREVYASIDVSYDTRLKEIYDTIMLQNLKEFKHIPMYIKLITKGYPTLISSTDVVNRKGSVV
jgi:hypothetical protein